MAQIGKREFERIAGAGGMREGAGAARSRLAAALRIDEVPRATLAAIAVLAVLAAVLGAVLLGRLGGVSVNAFLANSTNEPAPIAPSKRRRFRQRKPAASG